MNEIIFLFHLFFVIITLLIAAKIGKSALISCICLQGVFSNLFLSKQIFLIGFSTIPSDVFAVGGLLGMNLLQEFYGKKEAQKTIYISLFILLFYLCMSLFQLWYIPSSDDCAHQAYSIILSTMPRITLASLTVYATVQQADIYLYGFLKKLTQGRQFILRNSLSLICSQILDTVLFSFLGLYGNVHSVIEIILVSLCIKIIAILCMTPFTALAKSLLWKPHD